MAILSVCVALASCQGLASGHPVQLEMADGSSAEGQLEAIDAETVRVNADGADQSFPVATIRRVVRAQERVAAPPPPVIVTTNAGWRLSGDDFSWTGDAAALTRGAERLELPIDLVQMVAWRRPEDGGGDPAWLKSLPDRPDSDLVIVGAGAAAEFVSCAITGVSEESVTVVLDGETIPVKRAKVAGLRWLRPPQPATEGRIAVATAAGRLEAAEVAWSSSEGLVLDGRVRAPAAWLEAIDYAAGRTVWLTNVAPERIEVEPYFGGLKRIDGLAGFFAPRRVASAGDDAGHGLVMRPRTVGVWRVPTDSRRFRGGLRTAGGATPRAVVAIDLDGREIFRHEFQDQPRAAGDAAATKSDAGPTVIPIDIDVAGARRLTLTVDFAAGGLGGPVTLDDARFEK